MSATHRIELETPLGRTDVVVGAGVRQHLADLDDGVPAAARMAIVIDENVARHWPEVPLGERHALFCVDVPAGEAAKTRDVLAALQDALLDLRRDDVVVAIGGGAVLDVAGFAAATVRRGVAWIAVATSVVAMADAAIGGKVAINHERGKNLLGSFHPPRHVICDVDYLETLPDRERVAGLAEVYKCGRLGAAGVQAQLTSGVPATPAVWADLIHACAALKARIVERDERDHGERRKLNYGHTVGHALERLLGNEAMRHGEGVAIGMVAATALAMQRGWASPDSVSGEADALQTLGLPVRVPDEAASEDILAAIREDKKRSAATTHTFVLPRGDELVIADDITDAEVLAAIEATRAY